MTKPTTRTKRKNGRLGSIAAFTIPQTLREVNAFELGARAINPRATVKVVRNNSWFARSQTGSPGVSWFARSKHRRAVISLLKAGVGAIGHTLNDPVVAQTAQKSNIPGAGESIDPRSQGPKTYLESAVWNWTPTLKQAIQSILSDSWKTRFTYGGMSTGSVQIAARGSFARKMLTARDLSRIHAFERRLATRAVSVFTGPTKPGRPS